MNIYKIKRQYATWWDVTQKEYMEAKRNMKSNEFRDSYVEENGCYYFLEYPDKEELESLILHDKLGEISSDIKFFKILTIVGMVLVIILFLFTCSRMSAIRF